MHTAEHRDARHPPGASGDPDGGDGSDRDATGEAIPLFDPSPDEPTAQERIRASLERERAARARAEAAERETLFLARASEIFNASLDLNVTLARVASMVVPALADWCIVDMLSPDGSLEQLAVAHSDPAKVELIHRLRREHHPARGGSHPLYEVLRTGRIQLIERVSEDQLRLIAEDPGAKEILEALGETSNLIVPISIGDRRLGVLTLVFGESGRTYTLADIRLAEEIARRAALAIDNARLYALQKTVADTLQTAIRPPAVPAIPGVDLAAVYEPAGEGIQAGGDVYDVVPYGEGVWLAFIADVSGTGPVAASLAAFVRHTIRALTLLHPPMPAMVELLDRAWVAYAASDQLCTVCLVRVEPRRDRTRLAICCAGHPPPYLRTAAGEVVPIGDPGPMIGIDSGAAWGEVECDLTPGDTLMLYTDGAVEARHAGTSYGEDRLLALLQGPDPGSAAGLARAVRQSVLEFTEGSFADDVALLVIRATGSGTGTRGPTGGPAS